MEKYNEGIIQDLEQEFGKTGFENPYLQGLYLSISHSILKQQSIGFFESLEDKFLGAQVSFPEDLNIDYQLEEKFFNQNIFDHLNVVCRKIRQIIQNYIRKNSTNLNKTIFVNFRLFLIDPDQKKVGISFFPSYEKNNQNHDIYESAKQNILVSNPENKENLLKILDKICFFPSQKSYIGIIKNFFLQDYDYELHNSYLKFDFFDDENHTQQIQEVFQIILEQILIQQGLSKSDFSKVVLEVEKTQNKYQIKIKSNIIKQPVFQNKFLA